MFESFLEKLIINHFGQYISGLDRNKLHLAIWSGNIVIEDLNLKPEILDFFNIPINLRFSSLGKLQLQIPWSSLSKTPVEIILDKILIIATPKHQKDWKFIDYNTVSRKMKMLNEYAKNCIKNFLSKQKTKSKKSDEKEGFLDKLSMKVLDNLQLTIRNIHVRFEDESSNLSFGITLDEIIMITTDEAWNRSFIDRTEEKNKEKPMNKLLRLRNFGVYWNSKEVNFLVNLDKFVIIEKLNRMILKENSGINASLEYIISISAEAKLIQNHSSNFELPEYKFSINLQAIELHLKNEQFEQIIRNFETYIQYNKMLMLERKKINQITEEKRLEYREFFMRVFPLIQRSELKNLDSLDVDTCEFFKTILNSISCEELCQWARKSLKEMQKSVKVQELEKIKKKGDKWFKWGDSSSNIDYSSGFQLTSVEEKEIEDFIEKNFGESESVSSEAKRFIRPADKPCFELSFYLEGGSIYLSKKNQSNDQEGVKLHWHGFLLNLLNFTNGLKLKIILEEIGIDMITEYVGNKTPIITPILYKGNKVSRQNFFRFLYEKNPINRFEDQAFSCGIDSIELVYHPLAFNRLFGFFEVKTKDEAFKTAAWEQIEKLSDISHERVQDLLSNSLKLKVDFQIDAPIIIIPFIHNNDQESQCWVIDLGSFELRSDDEKKEEFYEVFRLKLADMKMQYFPKRKLIPSVLLKYQRKSKNFEEIKQENEENKEENSFFSQQENQKEFSRIFNVIEEYTIEIELLKLKPGLLKDPIRLKNHLPAMVLKIELPKFQISLNKTIYKNLINLSDTLHFSDIGSLELLQNEKMALLNSEIKSGSIKKRGNTIKSWKPYYVIFSGGYLYFFNNQKDLSPVFYIYIKKAEILEFSEENYAFIIKNKNEECYLACENKEDLQNWIEVLKKKIEDFSLVVEEIPVNKKKRASLVEKYSKNAEILQEISLRTQFHIKEFDLAIIEENSSENSPNEKNSKNHDNYDNFISCDNSKIGNNSKKSAWITLSLRHFEVNFEQKAFDFSLVCEIKSLLICDTVVLYTNPEFQKLVFIEKNGEKCSLIIRLKSLENKHPNYCNIDLDLSINSQNLYINWKPETLLKLGEYIRILREYQKFKAEAEIITNPLELGIGNLKSSEELIAEFPEGIKGSKLLKRLNFIEDKEKILLKARFEIEEITINFIHKQTHCCLAQGHLSNSSVDIILRDLMFQIDGNLSNLQIFDMTNYPKTLNSNDKLAYKDIKPYELLGLGPDNTKKSRLNIRIISFENACIEIKGNITTIFQMDISSITCKYHHQPIMRIVDYALIQVVSLITDPKYLTLNEEFYQKKPKNQKEFEPKKFVGDNEEVLHRVKYPTFLFLKIAFEQPVILLKPTPDSQHFIELTMSQIALENDQCINPLRLIEGKKPMKNVEFPAFWCEDYCIFASDLHIYLNKKEEKKAELAIPVLLNLKIEKILLKEELNWLLMQKGLEKSLSINNNYIIKGLISPIILKLYRDEYLFILKFLFHNITFDDTHDQWFIYDFDIVSHYDPNPITFQLDFHNITLFGMHSRTNMPFSSITMQNMRLKWVRDKEFNVDVILLGQSFSSNYFESFTDQLAEKSFIGNIGKGEIHDILGAQNSRTYSFDLNKGIYKRYLIEGVDNKRAFAFEIEGFNEEKVEFNLKVLMTPRGEKSILIVFSDVKLLAQTSVYMNLFYFAQLDDSVYPSIDSFFFEFLLKITVFYLLKAMIFCRCPSFGRLRTRWFAYQLRRTDMCSSPKGISI